MSFKGKTQRAKDLETFANALRACLGLQPLYGEHISVYKIEYELPFGARPPDEWFRAAPHELEDREQRKDRVVALALRSDPLRRYQARTRGMQFQRRTL